MGVGGLASPGALISIPAGESNTPRLAIESAVDANDFTITQYEDGSGTYTMLGQNVKLNSSGNNTVLDSAHRTAAIQLDARNHGNVTFYTGAANAVGERLRITSDGQVNINAASESLGGKVLIRNDVNYNSTDFDDDPTLFLLNGDTTTGVSEAAIVFAGRNTSNSTFRAAISGNGSTGLKFYTTSNTELDDTPAMLINGSGNIGIGTDNPYNSKLQVFGKQRVSASAKNLTTDFFVLSSTENSSNSNDLIFRQRAADNDWEIEAVEQGIGYHNVWIKNGNLKFTSGKGIDFSATSDASGMSSELLDDYEEGTWTPTVLSAGSIGSPQYNCTYTKIGRLVTVNADIHALTDTTSSSNIEIGGMPYISGSSSGGEWSTVCHGERYSSSIIVAYIQNSSGWKIKFRTGVGSGNYAALTHAAINDNGTDNNLRFTLTYEVV
jgi:hypothetical protein